MRGLARALYLLAERRRAAEDDLAAAPTPIGPAPAYDAASRRLDRLGKILPEADSFGIVGDYGIAVPRHRLAASADDAVRAAAEIGYPVALKVQSPQLSHKSEAG